MSLEHMNPEHMNPDRRDPEPRTTVELAISGMTCASCAARIEK